MLQTTLPEPGSIFCPIFSLGAPNLTVDHLHEEIQICLFCG